MPTKSRVNLIDGWADRLATRIRQTIEAIPEAPTPVGMRPVPRAEQKAQYAAMRDDPAAWAQIIQEHGVDGAIGYWQEMEKANGTATDETNQDGG
jgi:hypothetical protein